MQPALLAQRDGFSACPGTLAIMVGADDPGCREPAKRSRWKLDPVHRPGWVCPRGDAATAVHGTFAAHGKAMAPTASVLSAGGTQVTVQAAMGT